jgi:effector-binding domain-containing protein
MTYEFAIHHTPETAIISIRERVEEGEFPAFLGLAFPELFGHVGRHGVIATGHPFVIYHAFGPDRIDAEVCVPVAGPAPVGDRIKAHVLPAATIVRTLHVGPYEELGAAYQALSEWVGDHGYATAGPIRERYLNGPAEMISPADYRTEIDLPVVPVAAETPTDAPEPVPVG